MAAAFFTVDALRQDGFDITLTNPGAGGLVYDFELNREDDFASDDTLLIRTGPAPAGQSQLLIRGLPNDTPFYIRTRNFANDPIYSLVRHVATQRVAPAVYDGYGIDKATLVVPAVISNLTASYAAGNLQRPGFPPANLLRDNPQATWQVLATSLETGVSFETSGEMIDTIALLGTMVGDGHTLGVYSSSISVADAVNHAPRSYGSFRCSPTIGRRRSYHAHSQFTPTNDRFWYVSITGPSRHLLVRNLVAGLARQSINAAAGNGFAPVDQGSAARGRFGAIDRISGWRGRTVDFDMAWLTQAEYHTKWADLPGLVGKTKSVLVMPNSKRNVWLNDQIGFGPITNMRGETLRGVRHSQSIEIDSAY